MVEVKAATAPDQKQHVTFAFDGWFSRKAGLQHTLHPAGVQELAARRAVTEYKIETITGDKRGAGTDAEVHDPCLGCCCVFMIRIRLLGGR